MAILDNITLGFIKLRYLLSGPKARENADLAAEFRVDPARISEMRQAYDPIYNRGETILSFSAWVRLNFDKYNRGWHRN